MLYRLINRILKYYLYEIQVMEILLYNKLLITGLLLLQYHIKMLMVTLIETLLDLLANEHARYTGETESARRLISVGQARVPDDLDPIDVAAWTAVARTLLNLDESLVRN